MEQVVNKYPRTFHIPGSQQVHSDDKIHPNPDYFLDKEVVITEKLDGGNTALNAGKVYARSTGQEATQGWFAHVKRFHAWKTMNLDPKVTIYGEDIAALHSIEYEIPMNETYKVFAIRENDKFLSWDDVMALATQLDFETVPVLFRGKFTRRKDILNFFEKELSKPSKFGNEREGFVMRIADEFDANEFSLNVCKFVRKGHVQTDKHWTTSWTWNDLGKPSS